NLNGYNDVQNVGNQVILNAVQNPIIHNVRNQNGLIVVPGNANQNPNENGNLVVASSEGNATGHNGNQIRCYNCRGLGHFARNGTVRPRRRDVAYLQTQLLIAQKEEAGIQFQAEEFDLMAAPNETNEAQTKEIFLINFTHYFQVVNNTCAIKHPPQILPHTKLTPVTANPRYLFPFSLTSPLAHTHATTLFDSADLFVAAVHGARRW
nr:hypothetical protein [Tanacetum cinerariifolium]